MQLPADPSRGEAEGVVKDAAADKEIAGKLELLKGGLGFVLLGSAWMIACRCRRGSRGLAHHVMQLARHRCFCHPLLPQASPSLRARESSRRSWAAAVRGA